MQSKILLLELSEQNTEFFLNVCLNLTLEKGNKEKWLIVIVAEVEVKSEIIKHT